MIQKQINSYGVNIVSCIKNNTLHKNCNIGFKSFWKIFEFWKKNHSIILHPKQCFLGVQWTQDLVDRSRNSIRASTSLLILMIENFKTTIWILTWTRDFIRRESTLYPAELRGLVCQEDFFKKFCYQTSQSKWIGGPRVKLLELKIKANVILAMHFQQMQLWKLIWR